MRVVDEGLGAEGQADAVVRVGSHTVWVDGWTPAGPEALARALVEQGPGGVAGWPGEWAAVAKCEGRAGLHVAVDAFAGRTLFTDGTQVASDVAALGDLRLRPLDPQGLRPYVDGADTDPRRTPVEGVWRVPAGYGGHVAGERSVRLARIWVPRPREVKDPVAALRAVVETAVRDRLAAYGTRAVVALSGGLDSSVVAGVLADLAPEGVTAVSNRFEGWAADETPWTRAVTDLHGLSSVDVDSRALDPVEVLDLLEPPGFPPIIVNHHLNLALLREAGRAPLWTGFGGDEVFGHGFDVVRAMVEQGRPLRGLWDALWLTGRFRHGDGDPVGTLRLWGARWVHAALPDRARRVGRGRVRGLAQRRVETLTNPLLGRSREEQQRLAGVVGGTLVLPLLDPRVAEVALSVPVRDLVKRGRTRWVAREAFADLLPRSVRRRPDKADLSESFGLPLRDRPLPLREDLLSPFVPPHRIEALRAAFEAGSHDAGAEVFRLFGASRWLEWHTGHREAEASS